MGNISNLNSPKRIKSFKIIFSSFLFFFLVGVKYHRFFIAETKVRRK